MPSRISANESRAIFEGLVPGRHRKKILKCIARSVQVSHQLAPLKWGLRINAKSIMLKVGFVETLTLSEHSFHWLVERDSIPQALRQGRHVELRRAPYRRAPRCDSVDVVNLDRAIKIYDHSFSAHAAALQIASRAQRRKDILTDHAPHLIDYISQEVAMRLPQPGWFRDAVNLPEGIEVDDEYYEGAATRISVNRYERDLKARERCIEKFGYCCVICKTMMSDRYGAAAKGLIHVHHLRPLSMQQLRRKVDPIKDLRPVCPNCHAVVHLRNPPFSISDVKKMLKGGAI